MIIDINNKENIENRTLYIDESSIFKVKIEHLNDLDQSFFKKSYEIGYEMLKTIVLESRKKIESIDKLCEDNWEMSNSINNIISFVGERGSGKTSIMKSFINILNESKTGCNNILSNTKLKNSLMEINKYNYYITDVIDPSIFNQEDSMMEIVIAELFRSFKKEQGDFFKRQETLRLFENVYNDIRVINKEKNRIFDENLDNIEVLLGLSSAISLQKNIYKLVDNYLKFYEKDFLIIPIDDLDMNLSAGAKMLEDIRKYLSIPNVIIIMATKITQLSEVVKQRNIKDLKELSDYNMKLISKSFDKYKDELYVFDNEINNKTQKYLEKLLPVSRRVILPEPTTNDFNIEIQLENNGENEFENRIELFKRLFYEKLKIIMVSDKTIEVLMPRNLRGLIDFTYVLYSMDTVSDNDHNWLSNINNIKEKIYNGYLLANERLTSDIVYRLLTCKLEELNKVLIVLLNNYISEAIKEYKNQDFKSYINELEENSIYLKEQNISYGDVITWLSIYEGLDFNNKEKVELLKLIYTIRLMEALCTRGNEIVNVTGIDFIGNYFEILNDNKNNNLKVFLQEVKVQGGENCNFNINLNKDKYSRMISFIEKTKITFIDRPYGPIDKDEKIYLANIPLYNIFKLEYENNELDEELSEELNKFKINMYHLYSCLEPRYEDKGKLYKFNKNDINYKYIIANTPRGLQRNYYFKAFNIITSYIFNSILFNEFLSRFELKVLNKEKNSNDEEKLKKYEKSKFLVYLLNVECFMSTLKDININFNQNPMKQYDNSLDFYFQQSIIVIQKVLVNKLNQYKSDIKCTESSDLNNIPSYLQKIINLFNKYQSLEFILENIFIKRDKRVIGNFESSEELEQIIKDLREIYGYMNRKVSNTNGSTISNYILNNLIKPSKEVQEDYKEIFNKYIDELDELRKDIGRTEPQTSERKLKIDQFNTCITELSKDLKNSFEAGGEE